MSNRRIIFFTHYTDLYGANRSLLNLIDGLLAISITNILIVTPGDGRICDELKKRGVTYCVIPFVNETYFTDADPGFIKKAAKFVYNWYVVVRYARRLQKNRHTLIHSNASATLIGAYFSFWLRVPHVWHLREFGLEDYNFNYNFGYRYFNYWLNKANAVIAISKAIYIKRLKDCKAPKKEIIYNGVIFSRQLTEEILPTINSLKKDSNKLIFGIIGLICKEKGQEEAIEAFYLFTKVYNNAELLIAGNGADKYVEMLKQKVNAYNLEEKVIFTGFIETVNDFYNRIDCLLMCSKNEALGRVTIEAMSNGVPVIGYDNAGTSEIIQHAYNGLLYSGSSAELSEMMQTFAENNVLRNSLAQNALQTVKANFTIETYSKTVLDIYLSVEYKMC